MRHNLLRDPSGESLSSLELMVDELAHGNKQSNGHGSQAVEETTTSVPPNHSASTQLLSAVSQDLGINLADYDDGEDGNDYDRLFAMSSKSKDIGYHVDTNIMDVDQSQHSPSALSSMPPPAGLPTRKTPVPASSASSSTAASKENNPVSSVSVADNDFDDDDELFSAEFMREFENRDSRFQRDSTKSPYPRRQTLLSLTGEDESDGQAGGTNDDDDTLGLSDLSISQRHSTRSGKPLDPLPSRSREPPSTLLSTSSSSNMMSPSPSASKTAIGAGTTFMPSFSNLERFRAGSLTQRTNSQELSQYEELLEMTDRQSAMANATSSSTDANAEKGPTTAAFAGDVEDFWEMEDEDMNELMKDVYAQQDQLDLQLQRGGPSSSSSSSTSAPTSSMAAQPERRKHTIEDRDSEDSLEDMLKETDRILAASAKMDVRFDVAKKTRTTQPESGSVDTASRIQSITPPKRSLTANFAPQHDYTLPPETGSFVKAKNSRGQTFFLPKKPRVRHQQLASEIIGQDSPMATKSLLGVPIHRMMDELETEIAVRHQEALNRIELESQAMDQRMYELDTYGSGHNFRKEELWVDKYRPRHYTDLMGDEHINREVLSWIKEWDQCVFGRKYRKSIPAHKKQYQEFKRPDPLGRPDRKILLLTGPPGLGKTTMAHVIAKQAGYNVIEVNASDDRTGAAIKGKIESALEIQSIRGSDKPNLLIIDEIDGASSSGGDQSFIKLLVDIASVEALPPDQKSGAGGLATTSTRRGRKNQHKKPLMRPIICICNDQYATVLRPLRAIAQVYQFRKPSIRSVVRRLQQICELEQLAHDTRACGMLYEITEGDMRSCLNTLQFIKNKIHNSALDSRSEPVGLTVEMLGKAAIGRKDQNKSLYSVWEELFQANYARKNRSALKVVDDERDGLVRDDSNAYVSRLVNLVHTNGEYEKLMQGCFENFLRMTFHDTAMSKVVESTDWIAFYDRLNARASTQFEFELMGYIGYSLVSFHRFFAGSVKQTKIEYPRKDYEAYLAHKANESIVQAMLLNLSPALQLQYKKTNFATELLAPLLRILSPNMRPVNKQLIKADERMVLKRLVDVMIQFRLTFVQEKLEDGQFVYRLEPALEKLGDYAGIGLKNVMKGRYATRQLIAQEIEVELVRRQEALKEEIEAELASKNSKGKGKGKTGSISDLNGTASDTEDSKSKGKKKQGDSNGNRDLKEREAVDFFGRPIVQTNDTTAASMAIDVAEEIHGMDQMTDRNATLPPRPVQNRVWYRFNEGFSNAVKAKVFMHEFF
ncbi:hypothetical protein BGW41_001801 [Actinomortierella wolfii]|nr:hypothetical protein BGW41_001801 [Actinomortierella wolfii]